MWKISKKWIEDEGLVNFTKKDIKKRQLCRISAFFSGERLFEHVVHENVYGSLVYLGLMHYLSTLYEEEINQPKNVKE